MKKKVIALKMTSVCSSDDVEGVVLLDPDIRQKFSSLNEVKTTIKECGLSRGAVDVSECLVTSYLFPLSYDAWCGAFDEGNNTVIVDVDVDTLNERAASIESSTDTFRLNGILELNLSEGDAWFTAQLKHGGELDSGFVDLNE